MLFTRPPWRSIPSKVDIYRGGNLGSIRFCMYKVLFGYMHSSVSFASLYMHCDLDPKFNPLPHCPVIGKQLMITVTGVKQNIMY